MEFKKQFKEAHPETIGETDSHFDKSNYIDWIDKEYAQLKSDKAELLEALEKISKVTDEGYITADTDFQVWESELKQVHNEIESIIQKHKQ